MKKRHKKNIPENINTETVTASAPERFLPVLVIASIVLLLKLFMSYNVYGTNDITYWMHFADTIQKHGTFKIYSLIGIYNHPPLMSWILKVVSAISSNTSLAFPFVFRLMPIFADFAGIMIIWKILGLYGSRHRVLISSICAINPVNFFISGFHGNTDPILVFLVLLAAYLAEEEKPALSGTAYGLSLCVKIVPILLLPAFLFHLRDMKKRIIFAVSATIIPAIVFLPYLAHEYNAMVKNIFLWSGLKGIWGIGHICRSILTDPATGLEMRRLFSSIGAFHTAYGKILFLIVIVVLLKLFNDKKVLNMTEGIFLTFCAFLALTPGFGVQYLSWLSVFAVMVTPILGTLYVCIGGIFLFRVYYYWCDGAPPYYANSDVIGQWVGFEKTLDLVVWVIVVAMLIAFIYNKLMRSRSISRR